MNNNSNIISIVEGDGEKDAVPGLLRRILHERLCRYDITILRPKITKGKPNFLKKWKQFIEYAAMENCDAILVLMDADDECPYEQAADIANKVVKINLNVPIAVVYARAEYETWFICNLSDDTGERIRTRLGIPPSVKSPTDVESVRGAKEWLSNNMPRGRAYKETSDQESLTYHMDLELTHSKSRSFRRLCHAVEELVHAMDYSVRIATPQT